VRLWLCKGLVVSFLIGRVIDPDIDNVRKREADIYLYTPPDLQLNKQCRRVYKFPRFLRACLGHNYCGTLHFATCLARWALLVLWRRNFLSKHSNSTILCSIEACATNGEVESWIHYGDKAEARFYERLSSTYSCRSEKFYLFVAAMAGANVRVTTAVWLSQTAERAVIDGTGNRLWRQCNSEPPTVRLLLIHFLVKIELEGLWIAPNTSVPLKSWTALFQGCGEAREALSMPEDLVKRHDICAILTCCWLDLP